MKSLLPVQPRALGSEDFGVRSGTHDAGRAFVDFGSGPRGYILWVAVAVAPSVWIVGVRGRLSAQSPSPDGTDIAIIDSIHDDYTTSQSVGVSTPTLAGSTIRQVVKECPVYYDRPIPPS